MSGADKRTVVKKEKSRVDSTVDMLTQETSTLVNGPQLIG